MKNPRSVSSSVGFGDYYLFRHYSRDLRRAVATGPSFNFYVAANVADARLPDIIMKSQRCSLSPPVEDSSLQNLDGHPHIS